VFAAKLAGISREQVQRVLQLERRLEDLPALHSALTEGKISVNKLARVAVVATKENESELANRIKSLPQKAVEIMMKELQIKSINENQVGIFDSENQNQIGFLEPKNGVNSVRAHNFTAYNPQLKANLDFKIISILSSEIKVKLNELHEKGIDINHLLRESLERRIVEIAQQKEKIVTEQLATVQRGGQPAKSRYISTKVRQIIRQEFGTKCSIPHCSKPSRILHHTARFALTHSHDPRYIAPLCEGHHALAHAIDVKVQAARRRDWHQIM
jgi:hypothetical protein